MKLFIVLILISFAVLTDAQQYFVRGNVYGNNNEPLSFANIRAANSTLGTSSNKEGKYELQLGKGEYILICSFLGYASDS
ncbi:MAG: carboxypeptidase-like regulatory domain-containing protein, partial [Ignavibacteria bacterium]